MIANNLQFTVASLSGRKAGHPNPPATQTNLGTILGDSIVKQIELTQGKVALVDDDDFEELSRYSWCADKIGNNWYAKNRKNNKIRYMHRLIMGAGLGQFIDHKNMNGLDNRRANLRFCTRSQNYFNTKKDNGCSSKYKGVYWHETNKKWVAYINGNRQIQYLGSFDDEIVAAKTFDKAAKTSRGEFARLNFE